MDEYILYIFRDQYISALLSTKETFGRPYLEAAPINKSIIACNKHSINGVRKR